MNDNEAGDLFTTQDLLEIVELQMSLDQLPTVIKAYFKLKAFYYVRRKYIIPGLSVAVILLGALTIITNHNPLILIGGIILGVFLGLVLAWEIERGNHRDE